MLTAFQVRMEDDRAAAIIAGSSVETSLERAIKTKFRSLKKQEVETIFSGTGPLSTLSGKIHVAYALGIIGPQTKHDLIAIKDIRNVFAHAHQNITFRNLQIRRKCLSMNIVQRNRQQRPVSRSYPFDAKDSYLDSANVFSFLFGLMSQGRRRIRPERGMGDISL